MRVLLACLAALLLAAAPASADGTSIFRTNDAVQWVAENWMVSESASVTVQAACAFDFCDEFNDSTVDTSKWTVINAHADPSNSEPGCHKPANVTEGSGVLTMVIKKETVSCPDGTSPVSYTVSALQSKYNFTRGTVDVRAMIPAGQGPWPAAWLLGSDCELPSYLPENGTCAWNAQGSEEIDFMEFVGGSKTTNGNNLYAGGATLLTTTVTNATTNWHTYSVTWANTGLTFKVDGVTTNTISNGTRRTPTDPMFLILDNSVGASGGSITDANLPATMQVDWVHITEG